MELNDQSEVYHLRDAVWKAAGVAHFGGCPMHRLSRKAARSSIAGDRF